jgi:hypothetical protein
VEQGKESSKKEEYANGNTNGEHHGEKPAFYVTYQTVTNSTRGRELAVWQQT